jgi:hypothetical protein
MLCLAFLFARWRVVKPILTLRDDAVGVLRFVVVFRRTQAFSVSCYLRAAGAHHRATGTHERIRLLDTATLVCVSTATAFPTNWRNCTPVEIHTAFIQARLLVCAVFGNVDDHKAIGRVRSRWHQHA